MLIWCAAMSIAYQGSPQTLVLEEGDTLTVVADVLSSGTVTFIGKPGSQPASPVPVATGASLVIGPYASATRHYRVVADAGFLTYTMVSVAPISTRKQSVVAGGAAGDHTLAAIAVGDTLVSVIRFVGAGVAVTDISDITSEFTVLAGKINNAAGTNTTGDKLLVTWNKLT